MKKKILLILLIAGFSVPSFAQKVDTIKRWVGGTQMLSTNDVIQNLSQSKQFSIFVSLIDKAGLTDSLRNMTNVTVLAPINKAFEENGKGWMDTLEKPANKTLLRAFILSHVIEGNITSKDILKQVQANKGFAMLNTVDQYSWAARIDSNRNIVLTDHNGKGNFTVSKFDIPQKNGQLFILNEVLTPQASW